jgi:hypothetical protein
MVKFFMSVFVTTATEVMDRDLPRAASEKFLLEYLVIPQQPYRMCRADIYFMS